MENPTFSLLHPSFLKLMYLKKTFFLLLFIMVWLALYFFIKPNWLSSSLFYLGISIWVFFALFVLLFVGVFYKRKKYKLFDKNFTYQEGVLVHKETAIPFSRIQHVEIDEGPLERYFGLASLSIYTAGDSGRDLKVNGLELNKAHSIKDFITNYIKDE